MADSGLNIKVWVSKRVTPAERDTSGRLRFQGLRRPVIAEQIVRERWCARKTPGRLYKACRMPPATWATLEAIQTRAGRVTGLGPDEFRSALESLKDDRSRLWKLPPFVHVPVIVGVLAKSGVLRKLLKRHGPEGEVNPKRPGIPDLFLWWEEDGRVVGARFVEVKVGKERLGPHQRAEIEFLRACGCKAGVVRLQVVKG